MLQEQVAWESAAQEISRQNSAWLGDEPTWIMFFFMFSFGPDPFGGPSTRNRLTRIKDNLKMPGVRKAHFGSLALNCRTQILSFDLADFKNSPDLDDITLKFISNDQLPTSPPTKKNRKSSI